MTVQLLASSWIKSARCTYKSSLGSVIASSWPSHRLKASGPIIDALRLLAFQLSGPVYLPLTPSSFSSAMSLKDEKVAALEYDEKGSDPISSLNAELPDGELLAPDVRPSAEGQLVRMLDMRLLPTIILIFIMNYIDVRHDRRSYRPPAHLPACAQRLAVTSARLKGLEQDLGLTGEMTSFTSGL